MQVLTAVDYLVVGGYFLVLFGVAGWAIRRERGHAETSSDYFLAGRNAGWFVVGASLFASNIGSEHLVGLAGTGASSGVVMGQFEILASLALLLLGWLFVPFYVRSGVYTMPEYLERRYSPAARWYLSAISVVSYVLTKISVTIYAGGVVFETLMGVNFWTGALIIVVVTGAYTVLGGLLAVLYTDMVQAVVLVLGAVAVTGAGLVEVGGWTAMTRTAGSAMMDLWKPMTHDQFPWTGIVFGAPIMAVWYWCTDQYIVQRTLAARNVTQARRGTIFAGFLKQLPLFVFVIPGVIAYVLVQQGTLELAQADAALPALVGTLLPVGLRGLVAAGLLAALMSSLSSVFNSTSTLITLDLYKKFRPEATERQLVWVGQIATVLMVALGLAWIPMMSGISGVLYEYLQSVSGYIAPPISAVFLVGLFWRRINAPGAMAALLTGFVLGALRLVGELNAELLGGFAHWYVTVNFLHFAAGLFVVSTVVLVAVSLVTEPPPSEKTDGMVFGTNAAGAGASGDEGGEGASAREGAERPDDAGWPRLEDPPEARAQDRVLTFVLLAIVAAVMVYFTG